MIAYKGFNSTLACTMGEGTFQYEIGKPYKEEQCKTARNGFHCVEEPLEAIRWYGQNDSRYCLLEIGGDINEDGSKTACTEMTILKELSRKELALHECIWIERHPDRETCKLVYKDEGVATNDFVVVRGKKPIVKGKKGTMLFLIQEFHNSNRIKRVTILEVDGVNTKPNTYYGIDEKEAKIC